MNEQGDRDSPGKDTRPVWMQIAVGVLMASAVLAALLALLRQFQ